MSKPFDFTKLPEEQQVACYATFFAMAAADGTVDNDEVVTIFEALDLEALSEENQSKVRSWVVDSPDLEQALITLRTAADEVRYGVMVHLMDVALADNVVLPGEEKALAAARYNLGVNDEQAAAIENFIREVRRVRERGLDDAEASSALKSAAQGLSAVGVPLAAVYFSSSVAGLGAAGISSGLAALGMGLGLVPGIGVALLIGTATFAAVGWALNRGGSDGNDRKKRAQRLVDNLQATVGDLVERINALERSKSSDEREVKALRKRLSALQRLQVRSRNQLIELEEG